MSSESMDRNPEILEPETGTPEGGASAAMPAGAREWPGVSQESAPTVKFPGEDGGKSLAKMAARDLDAAVQLLAERAQYITGATGAAIALRVDDEMVCRASAGGSAPEIGARLQMDSGLSGESIRLRQLLRCDDTQTDGRVNRESCEALGIASVVVMPMLDGGEVIGVFELFSDRAYAFEDRDIVALERMGAMVRTALEQADGPEGSVHRVDDEPVLMEEIEVQGASKQEERTASLGSREAIREDDVTQKPEPVLVEGAAPERHEEDAAEPVLEETVEAADASIFLSKPEESQPEQDNEPVLELSEEVGPVDASEPDVGETARDAAARTEAWKASRFASEAPAATESHAGRETSGRIAFHMRVPKKVDARPAEAEVSAIQASTERQSAKEIWETPIVQDQDLIQVQGTAEQETSARKNVVNADVARADAATVAARELATSPRATAHIGSAAAAAPAREVRTIDPVARPNANEETGGMAPPPTAIPGALEEPPKQKPEVARPASAEGRARIAVSQVRKCEVCGFPVSEGRKLCLDCEKKSPKVDASAHQAKSDAQPSAMAISTIETTAEQTNEGIKSNAVATEESSRPAIADKTAVQVPEVAEELADAPATKTKIEAGVATRESIPEPPTPQFMVNAPDHYESWIVSHMYTAVGIALVVVGSVVYLLSR
jgi:putative methionine-R-sulfoxide reductase with GAF domain